MDIHALNKRRSECWSVVQALQHVNTPVEYEDRIALDARARLAHDAWMAAERDYIQALSQLSTKELIDLTTTPSPSNDTRPLQAQHTKEEQERP